NSQRLLPGWRDYVAGKRLPAIRITDHRPRQQRAEIARAHGRGWHCLRIYDTDSPARALEGKEEEQLVLYDRPAQRPAVLVQKPPGPLRRKKIASIEILVAKEFERRAVEVVCPGFGHNVDIGARLLAVLRAIAGGLKRKLRNRVDTRREIRQHSDLAVLVGEVHNLAAVHLNVYEGRGKAIGGEPAARAIGVLIDAGINHPELHEHAAV